MKYHLSILAVLILSACGSGSDDAVTVIDPNLPTAPSVPLNTEFGDLMNGARMNVNSGATPLTYNARVGRAAQVHANDMVVNNYFDKQVPNSDDGNGNPIDIGSRVTAQGYDWADIAELIEQGDLTMAEAISEFGAQQCDADGTTCFNRTNFEDFGIAKAGNGDNQKWVLVLAEPTDP